MVDYKVIGRRIKKYRKRANLTQQDLSDHLGVSTSYMSQVERGVTVVSLRRLDEIAELIGTGVQNLVADANEDVPTYLDSEILEKISELSPKQREHVLKIIETFK